MRCRFQLLLEHAPHVPLGVALTPIEFERGPYRIRIQPPMQPTVSWEETVPLSGSGLIDSMSSLQPRTEPVADPNVGVGETAAFRAGLLVIDFFRDSFDRKPVDHSDRSAGDPSVDFAFEVANEHLEQIRVITRSPQLKPVHPSRAPHRFRYTDDDGGELALDPELVKGRVTANRSGSVTAVTADGWEKVGALPRDYRQPSWDRLLLDAFSFLPSPEPAIVLASAAMEGFIDWCLEELVEGGSMKRELWDWIKTGGGDFRKEPSFADQYDVLLQANLGVSLKEEPALWSRFQRLKGARNEIAHGVEPSLANGEAVELVLAADACIRWVEERIPVELRRPQRAGDIEFTWTIPLTSAGDSLA